MMANWQIHIQLFWDLSNFRGENIAKTTHKNLFFQSSKTAISEKLSVKKIKNQFSDQF